MPKFISDQHARDINAALTLLRTARALGDTKEQTVCQKRLDWLLDRIPRRR